MSPNVPKCHPRDEPDRAVLSCPGNTEERRPVDNAVASSLSDAFGMTGHVSVWLPRPLGEGNALQRVSEGCPPHARGGAHSGLYSPQQTA